ncbi:MAG: LTA synthase family protein [Tannerellaceae bacterium]|jgi:phosphoglycerol transferase MdoB-like AlkP superfamily enzyme|nr:LTA synthase family protein [Tannerellaceae bacterium]
MKMCYRQHFSRILLISIVSVFLKFIVFDLIWASSTTFSSFSFLQSYINKAAAALFLSFSVLVSQRKTVYAATHFLLDLFLIANLMYFRTYYTSIPLESYMLFSNLSDFTASVWSSLSWADLYFPLSTLTGWYIAAKTQDLKTYTDKYSQPVSYFFSLSAMSLAAFLLYISKGGILAEDEGLQNANYYTVRTPVFTLFGSLYCDYFRKETVLTPGIQSEIDEWFARNSADGGMIGLEYRKSCIVILAESFESWVLEREVEGKEITPYLNALLKEDCTVYAPHVLTQVKGGRSIDAQLMLNTGLLPIENGAYSIKYPQTVYPSLVKAFNEKYGNGKSCVMTVDKDITWNQKMVAENFGYDSLIWKKDFILDEKIGSRNKLGDYSFLAQCAAKISREEFWPSDVPVFIQCVTYSGHAPFKLHDKYKQISFSDSIPQPMNDYITMANYTDRAIGHFIEKLRANGKLDDTMIIITGDHEGLASDRKRLVNTSAGKGVVSPERYTPFIAVNAPLNFRYEKVIGQIDLYPTIIDLLGLNSYEWKGLGHSILKADSPKFAVSPQQEIVGDTEEITEEELIHAGKAWNISDYLIRFNLLQ